jgi:catechol 2,3-dioxygenase-like lactoylglutathione lyase family enzyme
MDARIDVITLAVDDFERALAFYRALGFESEGVVATEYEGDDSHSAGAITMVHLDGGQILSLYPRIDLAKDAGIPRGPAHSGEFSLGQIVATRDEVDTLLAKARAAGAPNSTTAPGASTPATSATPTDTSGRSFTTQTAPTATPDRDPSPVARPVLGLSQLSWRERDAVSEQIHSSTIRPSSTR